MALDLVLRHSIAISCSRISFKTNIFAGRCSFHGSTLAQPISSSSSFCGSRICARLNSELQTAMVERLESEEELKAYLLSKATAVNAALDEAFSLRIAHNAAQASLVARGGKRIRPALCLAACEIVGGAPEAAMPAACAVELIHKMSILHTEADLEPTPMVRPYLLAFAFEHITCATKGVAPEKLARVVLELGKAAGVDGLVTGLFVEKAIQGDPCVDVEMLNYIHLHKTAALLEGSVASGAILGGGSEAAVERLRRYARFISLLFEVVVDILDHTHDNADEDGHRRRATYTNVLGLEQSKQFALQLNLQARHQLDMFDLNKAAPLYKLADYVLDLID